MDEGERWPNLRAAEEEISRENGSDAGRWLTAGLAAGGVVLAFINETALAGAVLALIAVVSLGTIYQQRRRLRRAFDEDRRAGGHATDDDPG
jgi:hypothetical protein